MKQQLNLTGIVLSTSLLDEYDKRLVILTKERGKITAFARGARRPGNPLMGVSSAYTYAVFHCYQGYDAYRVVSADVMEFFEDLKQDLDSVCYAAYFCELADYFTMEGTSDKNLLNLLYVSFRALEKGQMSLPLIRRTYEMKLLELEGLGAQVFDCVKCGKKDIRNYLFDSASGGLLCDTCKGHGRHPMKISESTLYTLQHIRSMGLEKLYGFQVSEQVQEELSRLCDSYLAMHVERKCKSLEMLNVLT